MKRFYWESVMRRIDYGTDAQVRQKCVIYDRQSSEPIAECWDVDVAELVVNSMNKSVEER